MSAEHARFMALWFLILATAKSDGGALQAFEWAMAIGLLAFSAFRSDR